MNDQSMKALLQTSFLNGGNAAFIEDMYEQYLQDPASIEPQWRTYFDKLGGVAVSHETVRDYFRDVLAHPCAAPAGTPYSKDSQVRELIAAYRGQGHREAVLDPLGLTVGTKVHELDPAFYGLSAQDLNETITVNRVAQFKEPVKLTDVISTLKKIYTQHIGYEYTYMSNVTEVEWLRERIESVDLATFLKKDEKISLLKQLVAADGLEKFLGHRYVGQKRFSLEGADVLIPLLNRMIAESAALGTQEIVLGMAHRGRLNVLANVVGKPVQTMLDEFDGVYAGPQGTDVHSGDVKYHLGYSSDIQTEHGVLHIAMAFNPSHLDYVCPVVEGSVRARQFKRLDETRTQVFPILIHGDAAFAGQGISMEVLNMSQVPGYTTGGTVHIIVNNQLGFTTSDPREARSTRYCSDVAKMLEVPIFHVNSDDPEAVMFVTHLALNFRMKFKKDVVIDLVCYRRFGHQEVDDPTATQPLMYQAIKQHLEPYKIYANQLRAQGVVEVGVEDRYAKACQAYLEQAKGLPKIAQNVEHVYAADWSPFVGQPLSLVVDTGVPLATLQRLAKALETLPAGMVLQPQVAKMMQERQKMSAGEVPMNWGYAEALAFASLVAEGTPIRMSGEDTERGTFAHRHAVLHDYKTGATYTPLQQLGPDQKASFVVINSILCELSILGFEYGFATSAPEVLVIWEAQFGDFANTAQVIFDQFISSAEQKWGRLCGLTMLLPHGYEGMGPEHSSARLERYLQLCAQDNMQVCVPTTPAQIFHLLRRQIKRPSRKPLIVMSPKSLLRHPLATSTLAELTKGSYQLIIPEVDPLKATDVKRVVMCAGKVYYDLLAARRAKKLTNVAIIRIEQLYPFPRTELLALLATYKNAKELVWCQEEPRNQGAWYQSNHNFEACLAKGQTLSYAGRVPAAAPAVGSHKVHVQEQEQLVNEALGI